MLLPHSSPISRRIWFFLVPFGSTRNENGKKRKSLEILLLSTHFVMRRVGVEPTTR